jgi:hypothetical protein
MKIENKYKTALWGTEGSNLYNKLCSSLRLLLSGTSQKNRPNVTLEESDGLVA